MILAAGEGRRMRPLTERLPKPLLKVGGKPLIQWLVERLARAGVEGIVINHSYRGFLIEEALGEGSRFGVEIRYSAERTPLGTAGGIAKALPLLGDAPFLAVSADIYCDYDYARLLSMGSELAAGPWLAHLVMVDNPWHHPEGDFALSAGRLSLEGVPKLNYGNIGVYCPELFFGIAPGEKAELGILLKQAIARGKARGEYYSGFWMNVGTPRQLDELDSLLHGRGRS